MVSPPEWFQYFPTYRFKDRDIAIKEYETATKVLEAEERIFITATQIILLLVTILGSVLLGNFEKLRTGFQEVVSPIQIALAALGLLLILSYTSLRYFAERQKAIVYASRKIIVLRRMLGLEYGNIQLVLPNWRVEGADNPFMVRPFPGWNTYVAYPFWIIASFLAFMTYFLVSFAMHYNSHDTGFVYPVPLWLVSMSAVASVLVGLAISYRKGLCDIHETFRLLAHRALAKMRGTLIEDNVEAILYRATLASYELKRLQVDCTNLKEMAIFIEDRNYAAHSGIDYKALLRATWQFIRRRRRSGGSTITMQLARTLFIKRSRFIISRKYSELMLARWLNSYYSKDELISIYLASVRYERGTFGILAAMKHYFGAIKKNPSRAESFFLIERVANVSGDFLTARIADLQRQASERGLLCPLDVRELNALYTHAIETGRIVPKTTDYKRLLLKWGDA